MIVPAEFLAVNARVKLPILAFTKVPVTSPVVELIVRPDGRPVAE